MQIPFAAVMGAQSLVGKDSRGTDLHQVSAELTSQNSIFESSKINMIMSADCLQVGAAGVVLIETDASVAGNASIHFMKYERSQVLIPESAFIETVAAVIMTGHDGHILEMALAAFVTNRAVMRMIGHKQFDNVGAKFPYAVRSHGNTHLILDRRHTGHHDFAFIVVLVLELNNGALPA